MYLHDPNSPNLKQAIASPQNVELMLKCSKSTNSRIKNLATLFLQDICGMKINESEVAGISSSDFAHSANSSEPTPNTSKTSDSISYTKKIKEKKVPRIVMNLN